MQLGKVGSSGMSTPVSDSMDIESSHSFSESGNRPPLSGKVSGKKHKKKKKKRRRRRREKFQSTLEAPQEDAAMTNDQLKGYMMDRAPGGIFSHLRT